jgi:hypothetical protein
MGNLVATLTSVFSNLAKRAFLNELVQLSVPILRA